MEINLIYTGDSEEILKSLPDNSINCCVTSPPYFGLRNYHNDKQLGLEDTPEQYVSRLAGIFDEVRRVLKPEGTLWLNLGDSYAGSGAHSPTHKNPGKNAKINQYGGAKGNKITAGLKAKDLIGIPWMVAFELRKRGWYLRQDIIWHKPNPMPESVTDRCTKAHEYIFLLSKSERYYFDQITEKATGYDAKKTITYSGSNKDVSIGGTERWSKNTQEKGQTVNTMHINRLLGKQDENYYLRNKRSVWSVNTASFSGSHFATFPEKLIEDCIKAGCPESGIVLDPFMGAGTTALVARKLNRNFIGIELNEDYIAIANRRLEQELGIFI